MRGLEENPFARGWSITSIACALLFAALVAVLSPVVGAIVFGVVVCIVLYFSNLAIAVPFVLMLLPFDFHRQINGHWYYLDFAMLGLALPLMRLPFRVPKLILMFVPYFAFLAIFGAERALNPLLFWSYVLKITTGFLLAYAISSLGKRESVIAVLGMSLVPLCLYGLYQLVIANFGLLWEWMYPHWLDQPWYSRARSFFSRPNEYGYFCAVVTIMSLAMAIRGYRRKMLLLCSAAGIVGAISSGSRGAMLGLAVSLVILLFECKIVLRTLAVAAPIALLLITFFPAQVLDRPDEPVPTVESRMVLWAGGLLAFEEHPVIGIGGTNLQAMMPDFAEAPLISGHNVYIQILSETGIVGFVLFFGPLIYLLWRTWKGKADRASLAAFLALCVFCTHGLFDNLMIIGEQPACMLLFFCALGLAVPSNYDLSLEPARAGQEAPHIQLG